MNKSNFSKKFHGIVCLRLVYVRLPLRIKKKRKTLKKMEIYIFLPNFEN